MQSTPEAPCRQCLQTGFHLKHCPHWDAGTVAMGSATIKRANDLRVFCSQRSDKQ